uniref:Uncharacterized protein n=1 Tax=Cucumis melo TaxID=3656 RepID=A0A9I9EGC9_CUCME
MAYGGSSSSCSIPIRSIQCGLSGGACNVITGNPFGDLEGKAILVENTVAVRSLGRPTATMDIRADLIDAYISALQEVLDQNDTFRSLRQDVLSYLVRSQL